MVRVRVRKEKGGHLRFDYIKPETIFPFLKGRVFDEIRVRYEDLTLGEAEDLAKKGLSVEIDGDSMEVICSRE